MFHLLDEELGRLETLYENHSLFAIPTGILGWDLTVGGLRRGCVHLVAGPPGSGVTSLALTLATNAALRWREPVVVLSGQRSAADIARRALSAQSLVPIRWIESGRLSESNWDSVAQATGHLSTIPLRVIEMDETSSTRLEELLGMDVTPTPSLVVVDGVTGADTRSLRDLARRNNLAVLLTTSKTWPCSPGQLDDEADTVAVLHPQEPAPTNTRGASLRVERNRHGATGKIPLAFIEECALWVDSLDVDSPARLGPADLDGERWPR